MVWKQIEIVNKLNVKWIKTLWKCKNKVGNWIESEKYRNIKKENVIAKFK